MKSLTLTILVLSIFCVGGCTHSQPVTEEEIDTNTTPEALVPLNEIVSGGPPKDGIPPIDDPIFVSAADAEEFVEDTTFGMLVSANGEDKFYPYNILNWHEIVNDTVGNKNLTVTFCPLCATGIVFERDINGTTYDFGTSGKLYESNLIMYDSQTDTYWSQVLAQAIVGPLTGTKLSIYPSSIVEFGRIKDIPNLKVLSNDTGENRNYNRNPYQGYDNSDTLYFQVSNKDERLPAKTVMYAINVGDRQKAYVFNDLLKAGSLEDKFNDVELSISVNPDNDEITVTNKSTNERIVGYNVFWFSWATHNGEDGELWQN